MISIALVSIGLWCLIWIQGEYSAFKTESVSLRAEFIESQKKMLKSEVTNVVKYIQYMKVQSELEMKLSLKEHVYNAHRIALNIYRQNKGTKTPVEIETMIKDALRPIRFNAGRGYYFAVSMEGVEQLYPVKPEFEGKNLVNLQDSKGNFVIQDEINIITKSGEGFVKHYWSKPEENSAELFPKISFVKHFKPLDWYFGAGGYIDDAKKQSQNDVLKRISDLRFGTEGYFFGSTYQGGSLFSNGKITRDSGNIWDLTDPAGVKIIQEQKKAVENSEGGFVDYSWKKLNTSTPSPKISFVLGIPEWEWIIGAGVYLDSIEKIILENKTSLNTELKKKVSRSVLILAVLLCLVYFWSKRISSQIQKSVETFSSFLKKASTDSIAINPEDLQLKEFRDIAVSTNKMLEDRRQAEEALRISQNEMRTILDAMVESIVLIDRRGVVIAGNRMLFERLQTTKKDLIGHCIYDFFPPEVAGLRKQKYEMVFKTGNHVNFEDEREGIIFEQIVCPIFGDGNTAKKIVIFARDITEHLKLKAQLQQAQKMEAIGTLAGGIAHDFNNVLFPILGHADMLLADIPEDSSFQDGLNEIYTSALRAKALVRQILTFSRQGTTELILMKMQPVVKEVLKLIRS
ncbi:MAG: cache domain-containing protein, partial [Desulfobacterales bacterium]|nr:cache domain-containing protein [Desulfobacterales bacterium]